MQAAYADENGWQWVRVVSTSPAAVAPTFGVVVVIVLVTIVAHSRPEITTSSSLMPPLLHPTHRSQHLVAANVPPYSVYKTPTANLLLPGLAVAVRLPPAPALSFFRAAPAPHRR